jgi:hypothetical protein
MTRTLSFAALALILITAGAYAGQAQTPADDPGPTATCKFIDEDGDGFNDLAPDHDGDGVPNGLDPDYERPLDGTGQQFKYQKGKLNQGQPDEKGFGPEGQRSNRNGMKGNGYGPGDGSGTGIGPADGTGFGPGTGDCDGTGSGAEGVQNRRGNRR